MKRIRVVFALPSLIGGGAERVTLSLIQNLDRNRFEPILLLGEHRGAFVDDVPPDVAVHVAGSASIRKAIPGLVAKIRLLQPDIVYGTLGFGWALSAVRTLLPSKTRLVCRLGNTLGPFFADIERSSQVRAPAMRVFNRLGYERANVTVCQSDYMLADACRELEVDGSRFVRIHNPVDINGLVSAAKGPKPLGSRYVVSVGNLHWRKGYDLLIHAWSQLDATDLSLVILGEGDQRDHLQDLIRQLDLEDRVVMPGYVDDPYPWVADAEFFVSSSRYEGFANVILESLAVGTPVVATDCPSGNREILIDGVSGCLVEVSVEGLHYGLQTGLKNRDDWRARQTAWQIESRFSVDRILGFWQDLFEDVVSKKWD